MYCQSNLKWIKNVDFHELLLVLTLVIILSSASIAISFLDSSRKIINTGKIATERPSILHRSEIRGVHIIGAVKNYPHDWNVIADTLASYKINFVTLLFMGLPTKKGLFPDSEWRAAIEAFHSRGIEVWISYHVVGEAAVNESYKVVRSDGSLYNWNCPSNPYFRQEVKECVEFVASNYDIDGIMFDYARFPLSDMCYCSHCKKAFEEWLGETIPDDNWPPNPSDFAPGGSRYKEFMEWRTLPITNLIRDVRNWMLAINPNLKFGLAQWTLFGYPSKDRYYPTYWRWAIAQDTAYWVKEGYLDITMPMIYNENATGEPHSVEADLLANWKYITGGPEGKIPLIAFINTGNPFKGEARDPLEVKACIEKAREMGADGWILWCYGGPGIDDDGWHIDIRPYLDLLDLPETFSIRNIRVSVGEDKVIITWDTDLPATSKVEYSKTLLFNATKKESETAGVFYWDIDHIEGNIIENITMTTTHKIIISGLTLGQKYYFRIQSQGESGTATSKVLTFTVGK